MQTIMVQLWCFLPKTRKINLRISLAASLALKTRITKSKWHLKSTTHTIKSLIYTRIIKRRTIKVREKIAAVAMMIIFSSIKTLKVRKLKRTKKSLQMLPNKFKIILNSSISKSPREAKIRIIKIRLETMNK